MIEKLKKLKTDGTLIELYRAGLISWRVLWYLDMVQHYDICIKRGLTKGEALEECACKFGDGKEPLARTTVYKALKTLGYDYRSINTYKRRQRKVPQTG